MEVLYFICGLLGIKPKYVLMSGLGSIRFIGKVISTPDSYELKVKHKLWGRKFEIGNFWKSNSKPIFTFKQLIKLARKCKKHNKNALYFS